MDVKTTFLNGVIEEDNYIEQLEGFETFDQESHVCKLKRVLYGLNQAPCARYTKIDIYLTSLGFTKIEQDVNLYHILVEGKLLIIVLYLDDFVFTRDEQLIRSCKEDLAREFEIKGMGLMHYFLGLEVKTHGDSSSDQLEEGGSHLGEVVDATVYQQLVGSLMYLVNTQPDMYFAVNQLSQVMVRPTKLFWREAKHVLQYLRGTTKFGLWYRCAKGVKLCGLADEDWAGSPSN
eukprot:PITA_03473